MDKDKDTLAHDASVLKTSCVIGGNFIPEERKPIAPNDINRAKLNPRKDTIVISRMNTPALVGECGYVERDYSDIFLPDRLWMTRHNDRKSHCVRWLAYQLSCQFSSRVIKESATGTSGSMKNIAKGALLAVRIPLPPTKAEQEAIAEALGDADAFIESLEQLIAKKRLIKQGAMQELLTGRRRLPGFSEAWEVKRLSDICWYQEGPGVRNTQYTTTGVKLLNGTNIYRGALDLEKTTRFISHDEAYGPYSHFLAESRDIVIASSGITIDRFHEKVGVTEFIHQLHLLQRMHARKPFQASSMDAFR